MARTLSTTMLLAVAGALVAVGCAPSAPSPTPGALTVENRIANAIVVEVEARVGAASRERVIGPCGGREEFVPGIDGTPSGEWLVTILGDPTGDLDARLVAVDGDTSQLTGDFHNLVIMFGTGDIERTALPLWLTVTPTEVVQGDSAPAPFAGGECLPWAHPVESQG